jgi:inosose dehydratase
MSPQKPPLIETVLGGSPAEWDKLRERMAESLRDWAATAKKHDFLIAVKPHMNNALHRPEDALWLVEAVGSPNLRLAYDYSHYEAQGLSLDATLTQLIDKTIFIHVKDGERRDGKAVFLLPGRGNVDYAAYFRRLAELGYSGSVTVEVSGMIHQKADYDPVAAAKQCYRDLASAWDKAGLPKRLK